MAVRFRDVVALVCLCAVALVALDGRLACETAAGLQAAGRGLEPLGSTDPRDADEDAASAARAKRDARERERLEDLVAELQDRVDALQRENQRLHHRHQEDDDLDDAIERIKQLALEKQRASQRQEEPLEPLAATDALDDALDGVRGVPKDRDDHAQDGQETTGQDDSLFFDLTLVEEDFASEDIGDAENDHDEVDEIEGEVAGALAGLVVERSAEELGESEPLVQDEDEDENDESEEPVLTKPSELGFVDLGNGKHELMPQVSNKLRKSFRAVGTKFISLFHAWEHAGWKHRYDATSPVALYVTKPISKVPGSTGKMISQISKSSCIGGTKGAQLRCKVALAEKHGCEYFSLKLSPAQYNLREKADCERFFHVATDAANAEKLWIGKDGGSYHGKNIKIYKGLKSEIRRKYGRCTKDKRGSAGYIMMDYIANPQLIEGRKFDLRTYLLIASTKPFLVFYHKGFIRRSSKAYSGSSFSRASHITNHKVQDNTEGHFWSFAQLSDYLSQEAGFPEGFMDGEFRTHVKRATNFVFQAARSRLKRRAGAFMLFGLDWMIDADQNIHFLEANGNPTISDYPGTGLGPDIWNDMTELITALHREPATLGTDITVAAAFAHGGWEIVFNEAEELQRGETYNACAELGTH